MNKKAIRVGITCGILPGTTIIVYAITSLLFSNMKHQNFHKRRCFNLILQLIWHQQKWNREIVQVL